MLQTALESKSLGKTRLWIYLRWSLQQRLNAINPNLRLWIVFSATLHRWFDTFFQLKFLRSSMKMTASQGRRKPNTWPSYFFLWNFVSIACNFFLNHRWTLIYSVLWQEIVSASSSCFYQDFDSMDRSGEHFWLNQAGWSVGVWLPPEGMVTTSAVLQSYFKGRNAESCLQFVIDEVIIAVAIFNALRSRTSLIRLIKNRQ